MNDPQNDSLKERCEAQLIRELSCDPALKALCPRKQNSSGKPKMPRIAVVVTPGKEISPGANLFNLSAVIEFYFDAARDQTGASLDVSVAKCEAALKAAQARGEYGIILDGEQPQQIISDTIRMRPLALRLIAG